MKTKTYDINLIIVLVILFLLAAVCGCEEEPEDIVYYGAGAFQVDFPEPNVSAPPTTGRAIWSDYNDWPPKVIKLLDGGNTTEYVPKVSEPNEPELTSYIHSGKIVSDAAADSVFDLETFVPTWPDYIELEKDLICFPPDDNDVCTVGDGIEHLLLTKGTKIYFKRD